MDSINPVMQVLTKFGRYKVDRVALEIDTMASSVEVELHSFYPL